MSNIIQFPSKPSETVEIPAATFKDFYFQCLMGDINAASKSLETLFKVSPYDARQYATSYYKNLQADPNLALKTMEIKDAFDSGTTNEVLTLLQQCFGVSLVDAINMYGGMYANARQ